MASCPCQWFAPRCSVGLNALLGRSALWRPLFRPLPAISALFSPEPGISICKTTCGALKHGATRLGVGYGTRCPNTGHEEIFFPSDASSTIQVCDVPHRFAPTEISGAQEQFIGS